MSRHPQDTTGVRSPARDGTPVWLDTTNTSALDTLEFRAVLDVIASHCVGPLAAAQIAGRYPTADITWIASELGLVGELLAAFRRGEKLDVTPVPDLRGAIARLKIAGSVLELSELTDMRDTLQAGRAISNELARLEEPCPRNALLGVPPLDRAIERALELAIGDDGELLDTASPGLAAARKEVHAARQRLIRKLEALLRDLDGSTSAAGASVTMRGGRYVIPVRRDARSRPEGIIHDESGAGGTLFLEPSATIELGNAMREAVLQEEREVLLVLRMLTEKLRPEHEQIRALHAMAVQVDTLVARARWALNCDADVPALSGEAGALVLNAARHPLLLARGIKVIPFDLTLDRTERTLLISGPNTGGKTVLLKAAGLMIALTQSGIVPPAGPDSMIPIIHHFFVDIGDHQSLAADLSTFSGHVAALRTILDRADSTTLVILDEVGSGTDPAEGGALAMAVLETLTSRGVLTLATTHLGTLKELATRIPGVVNGSLQFDAATLSPTYRFTKGIPGRSYGLAIARRLGVAADVLAKAETLVPDAERQLDRLLAAVEKREQALGREEAQMVERVTDIERREAVTGAAEASLAAREAEWNRREKEAERERGKQAKAYLLEARKRVEEALALAKGAADEAGAREARRLVEEGVRLEREREGATESVAGGSAGPLNVGDRVRMATGATGTVAELRGDAKAVVLAGAMRLVVPTKTLTWLAPAGAGSRPKLEIPLGDAPVREASYELDLRGMRADEAESMVFAALDGAVLADQPFLRIIHGMGTGVLRDVVRRLLDSDKRVASFDFAPRNQGGLGVTVAVLKA